MTQIRNVKTILLGLVIVLGIFAQTKSSNAQQLETLTVAGAVFGALRQILKRWMV